MEIFVDANNDVWNFCVYVCVLIYVSVCVPLYVEVSGQPQELSVLFLETLCVHRSFVSAFPVLANKRVPPCSAFCFEFWAFMPA